MSQDTTAPGGPVVEGVREVHLGPAPLEAVALEVQRAEERGADRHGVDRRADVVDQARDGQLLAARAAADRRFGLEHGDADSLASQRRRGGQPVGAGADDDGVAQAFDVTSTGKSKYRSG